MIRRTLLLTIMSLPSIPGADCDKILGTWQGTSDSATEIRVEVDGLKRRFSICLGAGRCVVGPVVFDYDGKHYESKMRSDWIEYVTFRKLNDTTIEQHDFTNKGALIQTITYQIALDGSSLDLREVLEPTKENKTPKPMMGHYLRDSSKPKVADDPFVGYWKEDLSKTENGTETYIKRGDEIELSSSSGFKMLTKCDGKDHAVDFPDVDTINLNDENGIVFVEYKSHGTTRIRYSNTISPDGITRHVVGKDADGKILIEGTFRRVE